MFRQVMGESIRRERDKRGFSLRELSERLGGFGLELDHNALSRIERGKRGVEVGELLVIALALDVSPDVLVFPDDDRVPVQLTERVVEPAGRLRDWWSGRIALLGSMRRSGPSWPYPDEVRSFDRLRERGEHWRSRRPLRERRAYAREGMAQLVASVHESVQHAGRRAKLSAQDRANLLGELFEVARATSQLIRDLGPPDVLERQALDEVVAVLAAAGAQATQRGRKRR